MKKFIRTSILSLSLLALLVQSGCYGSFELTNRLYQWNGTIEDKNVRSLVLFALGVVQIYTIAAVVDAAVLNLIEFWNGSNPLSMADGEHEKQIISFHGKTYMMEARRNEFSVTEMKKSGICSPVHFVFTPENLTWNVRKGTELVAISRLEKDTNGKIAVRVYSHKGSQELIEAPYSISFAAFKNAIIQSDLTTASR